CSCASSGTRGITERTSSVWKRNGWRTNTRSFRRSWPAEIETPANVLRTEEASFLAARYRRGAAMPPEAPLADQLFTLAPRPENVHADEVLDRFLVYVKDQGLTLYPAQEEAILEVFAGKNVILNTPTGSGKSLVATAMHFLAMAEGRRSFYTCPIKALVSEKFF